VTAKLLLATVCALGAASVARADGLPVLGVDVGPTGVVAASGEARYVTLPAGGATVVARVEPTGGRVLGSRLLRGTFTIPAVAYDGSAGGLSADGRTLVLIEPRQSFPRARTTLAVLDERSLRPRAIVRLKGDFSFDAVSPRARWLYLIQYVDPNDPAHYAVRAYDLRAGRLAPAPVVDPHEPGEEMRGAPLTRAMSEHGRWAYTLYDGGGATPFVHALDTATRTARCIVLDGVSPQRVSRLRMRVTGHALELRERGRAAFEVDTRTFRVRAA
jgi:hypothetical protein